MPVSRAIVRPNAGLRVPGAGALLSLAGFCYVGYVASNEPFLFMTVPLLIMLEALGLALLMLFGTWGLLAVSAARRMRWRGLRIPLATLAGVWTLLSLFYLGTSMVSCWMDFRSFRGGVSGTLGHVAVE